MDLFTVMSCVCLFKVKKKFLRSTSLTVELLGCLRASYIPPDHVSQCSGCDMAHPQLAHTHFGKKGRGRGERMREGGGITRYEDGGGDWVSCPIFSALFLPLQLIHARVCVCICAHTGLQHMHDRHVTSSRGLHFKMFTKPMEAAKQRALWEQS